MTASTAQSPKRFLSVPAVALVISLFASTLGSACEIRTRVPEQTFEPSFIKHSPSEYSGMAIELATALLNAADCQLKFMPMPFKRGLQSLQKGKVDLMLNLSVNDERKTFINFVGPQMDETVILVVREDSNFRINSLNDIKTLPRGIGIDNGLFYGADFHQKMESDSDFKRKVEVATKLDIHLNKLKMNRLSGFLGHSYNVYYRIKHDERYKGLKAHSFEVYKNWIYFGFSKKSMSEQMMMKMKAAYQQISSQGKLQAILEKYRFSEAE